MDIQTIFAPKYLQQCPCCGQTIDMRTLLKVNNTKAARWYESSTSYRTACPECRGLVKLNLENSPWLVVILFLLFAGIASSILWPNVSIFMRSFPGRIVGILVAVLLVWLTFKQSKLVRDL